MEGLLRNQEGKSIEMQERAERMALVTEGAHQQNKEYVKMLKHMSPEDALAAFEDKKEGCEELMSLSA
jgi:hypothetical protein